MKSTQTNWAEWIATVALVTCVLLLVGWTHAAESSEQMMLPIEGETEGVYSTEGKVSEAIVSAADKDPSEILPIIVTFKTAPTQAQLDQ